MARSSAPPATLGITVDIPATLSQPPTPVQVQAPMREPVKVGQVLAEKYRIERLLAASGMGVIYLATHLDIEQPVAIKFLLESRKDPTALARFKREARAMGKVRSQHAVRVFDVDELDAETPFIVMEYLEGRDLHSLAKEVGKLPLAFTCDLLLQACEALAAAHSAGVVHRDLKPSNIFLVPQPDGTAHVQVIDFGIAKLRGEVDRGEAVTHTSTLVGSPRYMSPEQVSNGEIDHRVDVWALGIILQEMLTGQRCFKADGVGPLLIAIATQDAVPIESIVPETPLAIISLLKRTLQKDRNLRTPDVLTFAEGIAPFTPTGESRLARVRHAAEGSAAAKAALKVSGSIKLEIPHAPSSPNLLPELVEARTESASNSTAALPAMATAVGGTGERKSRRNVFLGVGIAVALILVAGGLGFAMMVRNGPEPNKPVAAAPPPPSPPPPATTTTTEVAPPPTMTTPPPTAQPVAVKTATPARPIAASAKTPPTKPPATQPSTTTTKPRDLFDDPK